MKPLTWDVFVTPGITAVTNDLPRRETAVVVDAFITVNQARALADWVAARGKNVTTICATHGHGDHFFGAGCNRGAESAGGDRRTQTG